MLTEAQEKFLRTISNDKIVVMKPWNPKTREVAQKLIARIKAADIELEILYMGASALGVAGINDIDIAILCPAKDFTRHLPKLEPILGKPSKISQKNVWWEDGLVIEGYLVEVYMTDPNSPALQEHFKIFEILKDDDKLRTEYQRIKENANGLLYREYQKRKYEFYNRVLGLKA